MEAVSKQIEPPWFRDPCICNAVCFRLTAYANDFDGWYFSGIGGGIWIWQNRCPVCGPLFIREPERTMFGGWQRASNLEWLNWLVHGSEKYNVRFGRKLEPEARRIIELDT